MITKSHVRPLRRLTQIPACALAFGALAFLPAGAGATQLDKNACAKLAQDLQNLKALDVDKLMENGPAWALNHLSPADLGLVRQYIDLDEQMKFRCSAPGSLVHLKHLDEEDEENAKPAEDASAGAAGKAQDTGTQGEKPAPRQPKTKATKPPQKAKQPSQANSASSR